MTSDAQGRRRGRLRGLLLALALLALALGGIETALRLVERAPTPEQAAAAVRLAVPDGSLTLWDPGLAYRLAPGILLAGHYPINAQGYRGPPLPPRTAATPAADASGGTSAPLRVVCLGDSSTFGLSVGEEETWPARLQALLGGLYEGHRPVEVLNAGVIGYSSEQNRVQLVRDVLPLRPDAVVLCPTAQNDTTLRRGPADAVLLQRSGSLRARLSQLRIVQRLGLGDGRGGFTGATDAATQELEPGMPGVGPRVAPERFSENLLAMAQAAAEAGVPCVFVVTPHEPERIARAPELLRSEERVVEAAGRGGARLVDVRADFAAYAPLELTSDAIHFTALGQQLIAIAVARALLREPPLLEGGTRAPFLSAWAVATEDGVEAHEAALTRGDLPPLYRRMADAVLISHLDERLLDDEAAFPAEFLDHDPFTGRAVGRPGLGMRWIGQWRTEALGDAENAARAAQHARAHAEHVVPEDAFLQRAGGEAALKARPSHEHGLPRLLTAFDSLIGAVPPTFDRRQIDGTRAFDAGEYETAIRLFDEVLELAPRQPELRYLRGLALRRAGRAEEARAEFLAVVESAPESALGLFVDGVLALQAGETGRAETALRAAIARDPGHAAARTMLARMLVDQGALDEAQALLDGALLLAADPATVRALLVEIAQRRRSDGAAAGDAR